MDNFYKKVDGITSRSQGFQNQLEFERIAGKYTIIGSEILVQKQIQNLIKYTNVIFGKTNTKTGLLQEYINTLIFNLVTGKVDVRDFEIPDL